MGFKMMPTYCGVPIAIVDKRFFGLRVKIDFIANRKLFWVWVWQIKYLSTD